MTKEFLILAINPGSTSTKLAIYQGENLLYKKSIKHDDDEILKFNSVSSQVEYRYSAIMEAIETSHYSIKNLDAVVGRGGFLKPLSSGTYKVNDKMIEDLTTAKYGEHASNLGAILAHKIGKGNSLPSFIVDPVVVDEMNDVARLSGLPELERKSHVHALNIKAVSIKAAEQLDTTVGKLNLVVAHLGGGISVVAHKQGKLIDVNNANNEGPYSPERAGGLPSYQLVKLCFSGKFSEQEMLNKLTRKGGIYGYIGTKDIQEVETLISKGDTKAKLALDSMIYQIAKEIGAMAAVLDGRVDQIILTGGIAFSSYVTKRVIKKVSFIAPVMIIPGEEELEALAFGALRVLNGTEQYKFY